MVVRGDAARVPLPDASVDLIVTSPPYFGLRSYTDGGEHYDGQIGSEAAPREYVGALLACTREWMRVLKPSGSLFVNLGDKYSTGNSGQSGLAKLGQSWSGGGHSDGKAKQASKPVPGMPPKSLLGLPWRYALGCVDDLGLTLRAEIIWAKPNGLPESVTDRVRRSHEQVFHFTKQPRYFAAVDEIREAQKYPADTGRALSSSRVGAMDTARGNDRTDALGYFGKGPQSRALNPLGKLPGSVWEIRAGEPIVRLILKAVADGALTIDEAERLMKGILWTGSSGSTPESNAQTDAGTGRASSTMKATGTTAGPVTATGQSTGSPTNSGLAPSLTDSPSTIDATPASARPADGTASIGDASTRPTSKPSPSRSTSDADGKPPRHAASTTTSSPQRTPMSEPTGTESAGPACEDEYALTGDVWSIPSQPLTVPAHLGINHFAAFPMELPRRIILGWSPPGICVACGEGRRPVTQVALSVGGGKELAHGALQGGQARQRGLGRSSSLGMVPAATITGYACACPDVTAPTRPAVVLDPFGGTGTTALVAAMHGRLGLSLDRSADYCRLARWRTTDPAERARALGVAKPPPVLEGQGALFGDVAL